MLSDLFKMCLNESYLPDYWNVFVVLVFKRVGERCLARNYYFVSPLSVVCKIFEKCVNDRFVNQFKKYDLSSNFWYGFSSSRSTT